MIIDSLFCTAKFSTDLKSRQPLQQYIQSITYLLLQTASSKRLKKDIDLYVLFLSPITGSDNPDCGSLLFYDLAMRDSLALHNQHY